VKTTLGSLTAMDVIDFVDEQAVMKNGTKLLILTIVGLTTMLLVLSQTISKSCVETQTGKCSIITLVKMET